MTCRPDESIAAVQDGNNEGYDYLPVVEDDSVDAPIVGLFPARDFRHGAPGDIAVGEKMDGLSDGNLIGADASILDYVLDVGSKPFRLTVSGTRIDGLVSWSDLQMLPVRAALFGLITGFEITMFDAIKAICQTDEEWLNLLSPGGQDKVWKEIKKSQKNDSEVDALLYTQICDKGEILRKRRALDGRRRSLRDIQKLRDQLAHANIYATTFEAAGKVGSTVRTLLELRRKIENQIDA